MFMFMFYVLQLLKLLSVGGASEDFVAQEEEDNVEENAIGFAMILPGRLLFDFGIHASNRFYSMRLEKFEYLILKEKCFVSG